MFTKEDYLEALQEAFPSHTWANAGLRHSNQLVSRWATVEFDDEPTPAVVMCQSCLEVWQRVASPDEAIVFIRRALQTRAAELIKAGKPPSSAALAERCASTLRVAFPDDRWDLLIGECLVQSSFCDIECGNGKYRVDVWGRDTMTCYSMVGVVAYLKKIKEEA